MKTPLFLGCGTAISTPFNESGVNFDEFRKFIEFQISEGIDSLIVCGTTGESATMSTEEKKSVIKFAIDVARKRIPIIAGTGSNNTNSAIEMSKYAESVGADGLLVVTPYYNKATQAGLVAHFKAIAESVKIPVIIYSVQSRTGVNILPETCLELSKIPNIIAIKEASGNLSQVANIASLCKDNLYIYSGNDDQSVPMFSLGACGVISVLSNIAPKRVSKMVHDFFDGKIEEARKTQLEAIPLINALFSEVNPIPVKEALNIMGFDFGIPRLPLTKMTEKNRQILINEMKNFNVI